MTCVSCCALLTFVVSSSYKTYKYYNVNLSAKDMLIVENALAISDPSGSEGGGYVRYRKSKRMEVCYHQVIRRFDCSDSDHNKTKQCQCKYEEYVKHHDLYNIGQVSYQEYSKHPAWYPETKPIDEACSGLKAVTQPPSTPVEHSFYNQ